MKNFIQPGGTLTVPAPEGGISSGDGVLIESLFGVAATDAEAGDDVEIVTEGVFDLPKSVGALDLGQPVYWSGGDEVIGTQSTDIEPQIGVAAASAASEATTARVKLQPVIFS